jgi:hypothetical protein
MSTSAKTVIAQSAQSSRKQGEPMQEFEIYLPTKHNDGTDVDPAEIARIKATLSKAFGGYTHLNQRSEGAWRMGGVTFRDEVTIVRVLDDGTSGFDMDAFRRELERSLQQDRVLIVARDVRTIGPAPNA